MKFNYKTKNNKKAFTLIELLIVIAIIGILFIVLVSRVDFATDKAKATGVQTDFRSFQVALDQVAKENAGFNMFGWDTGDVNGDHIRNSYDKGDTNQNGKEDAGETFIGRKTYGEEWTTIYTMLNPDTTKPNDTSAFVALETAINANLDPKLHITITPDVDGGVLTGNATITMANQARDPWKNEYHGVFITNAVRDNGADRGAIIIYSNGANGKWGSAHDITDGVVSITVPNNNKLGQDDMSIVSCYTYVNGYGEVKNMTTGFSANQNFLSNGGSTNTPVGGSNGNTSTGNSQNGVVAGSYNENDELVKTWDELLSEGIITVDDNVLTAYNGSGLTKLVVPQGITMIYECAFYECTDLISITLPNSLVEIDIDAFYGCTGLTSIIIPDSVTKIWDSAFAGCTNLANITMSKNISVVGEWVFEDTAYYNNSNNWEGDLLYLDNILLCSRYEISGNVTIRNNTKLIAHWAFGYREGLTGVTIPNSLTCIPLGTFEGCLNLVEVNIPSSIKEIGDWAFASCESLTSITIPDSVTTIGIYAFNYCYNLTSVEIPDSVINIGEYTFGYCSSLTSVGIPDSVTSIGQNAFEYCSGLTNIVIPDSVTSIGDYAFNGCRSLTSIEIPDGVTSIGKGTFFGCTSLESVVLSDNITSIGDYAFYNCTNLDNINIPNNLVEIGNYAFNKCKLSNYRLVLPDSVTSIGSYAFYSCGATYFQMSKNITHVGKYAFNMLSIGSVFITIQNVPEGICEIRNGMRVIADAACESKTNIVKVIIPNSITHIGADAFKNCTQLSTIVFNGTKAEWNAIAKGNGWNTNIQATYVTCLDGNVSIG